jgi:hypothetical protein
MYEVNERMMTDLCICTLFKQLSEIYLDVMGVKCVNKCELPRNTIRFGPSLVPFQYLLDSVPVLCLQTSGTIVVTVVSASA